MEAVTRPKRTKKAKKRAHAEPVDDAAVAPPSKKKPKTKKKQCNNPTPLALRTNQEDYQEWYDAEEYEWYDAEEGYDEAAWAPTEEEDNYPWPLWTLIYEELQIQEDPNVIHDVCILLQGQFILQPWQLKQAPRPVLDMLFPVATHSRHLILALQVQETLRQRSDADQSAQSGMAKAVHKLAREQEKARRANQNQDTSSDEEAQPTAKYDHYECMRQYYMEKMSQSHTLKVDKHEKFAKRAAIGMQKRGLYLVPGSITEFTPTWMKSPLPPKVEDLPTHAHWVAAFWCKALAQLATQGHTKKQTLSIEQLLTQFLNINKICIESTQKVGWHTENEMWMQAVESTRRMDKEFDLAQHFRKVTPEHLKEGKQSLDASYRTTATKPGKGRGSSSTTAETQVASLTVPYGGKGKGKSWKTYSAMEPARVPGKYYGKGWKANSQPKAQPPGGKPGGKPYGKDKDKSKTKKTS